MGLTGFNRARREAEARAIETEDADLDDDLDLPDTGTDAQPNEADGTSRPTEAPLEASAAPKPPKPAKKTAKAKNNAEHSA